VKRYDMRVAIHAPEHDGATGYYYAEPIEKPEGEWVRYEDADDLAAVCYAEGELAGESNARVEALDEMEAARAQEMEDLERRIVHSFGARIMDLEDRARRAEAKAKKYERVLKEVPHRALIEADVAVDMHETEESE